MRIVLALLTPLMIAATTAPVQPPTPQVQPPGLELGNGARLPEDQRKNCRGRIEAVREERGLPKLQRDNAKSDEVLLIAAVDKLIDGCEVLVMRNNTADIRPLPEFEEGSARLQPLR